MKLDIKAIIPVFELEIKNGREVVLKGAQALLAHIKENHANGLDAIDRPLGDRTFNKTGQMIEAIQVVEGKGRNPSATVQTKGSHAGSNLKNDALLKIHAAPESEDKTYPPALFIAANKDLREEIKTKGAAELKTDLVDKGKERTVKIA